MHYTEIVQIAENKLSNKKTIEELKDVVASGFTGTEIAMMVGHYLKHLDEKDIASYLLLKSDIIAYLNSCRKNGLWIT